MKMKPRCVPCLLNRVLYESNLVMDDERKKTEIMKKILEKMAEIYTMERGSAEIATEIHSLAYHLLGVDDPYKDLKERSNRVALQILPEVEKRVAESEDMLEEAILASIAGNSVDFGIAGSASSPEHLLTKFWDYMEEGLAYNDIEEMKKLLHGDVLYFTDNCGEVVFDKLVCKILKENYDIHLTLVCKEVPILTDATYEDVIALGFDEVVDEIMTTGSFAVGVDFHKISKELEERMRNASLIISKGMANYEAFSETDYRPIAYLLRIKCESIAEDMGLKQGTNVVKLYK
ncbi:MAG: DUF89 family protein [Thermoplasmata archaeon]|nr:DUF89 family protein [Thermoplasmata archaeon]